MNFGREIFKLTKHSIIYGFGQVASRAIAFFLIPLYTAYLTPEDYGVLQICRVFNYILVVILLMGMSSSMFRVYFNTENKADRALIINSTVLTFIIGSFIIVLPLLLFSSSLSRLLLGIENEQGLFILLVLSIFFESFFSIQLSVLRAEEKSKIYSYVNIVRVILYAAFNIFLIAKLKLGFLGSIQAGFISYFLGFIILIPVTLKNFKFQISIPYIKEILHIGIPLAVGGLGVWILSLSDRYMLRLLLPEEIAFFQVGLYSLGDKMASLIRFFVVMPFMLAWGSLMFSYMKELDADRLYRKVLYYFSIVIGVVGLFVSFFSKEIIAFMAQDVSYLAAYKVVPILSFSKIIYGLIVVVSVGVIITKKSKYVAIANISAACLNIILNFVLIPKYAMYGASIASLVSYVFAFCMTYYFAQKCYHISWYISRVLFFIIFIFVAALAIDIFNVIPVYKVLIFMIILLIIPMFKLVTYEELKKGLSLVRKNR
jgi:O-antigen/teichoic acid export membrane protein